MESGERNTNLNALEYSMETQSEMLGEEWKKTQEWENFVECGDMSRNLRMRLNTEKKKVLNEREIRRKKSLWNKPVAQTIPEDQNNLNTMICPEWKKLGGWMILEKQLREGGTTQKTFPLGCDKNYCPVCGERNAAAWKSRIHQALFEHREAYQEKHGVLPAWRLFTFTQRTRTTRRGSMGLDTPMPWRAWARMYKVDIEKVPYPDELDWSKPATKIARQYKKLKMNEYERVVWRARCTPKQKQKLFSGFWKILMERWEYQWGERMEYIASREWTKQCEIHIHAMTIAPRGVKMNILRDWIAREWMDITADAGIGRYEYGIHTGYETGAGVHAASYITKYISKNWGKSWGNHFQNLKAIGIDDSEWDWDKGLRRIFRSQGIEIPDMVDEQFNLYEGDNGLTYEFEPQLYRKAYGKYYYWMNKILNDKTGKYSVNHGPWHRTSRITTIKDIYEAIFGYLNFWKQKMRKKIATALYINLEQWEDKRNGEIKKHTWATTGIKWFQEANWIGNTQFKFTRQPMRDAK